VGRWWATTPPCPLLYSTFPTTTPSPFLGVGQYMDVMKVGMRGPDPSGERHRPSDQEKFKLIYLKNGEGNDTTKVESGLMTVGHQ
jgi:hypothetical protein